MSMLRKSSRSVLVKLFKENGLLQGNPTIQTGNELDYVLVSASLSSLVQQRVEWKVPFRPHAAVFQSLNWWQGQVPILQIDKQSVNAANPKPLEVKVLMENLTQDEHSVRFAECTAKLESSLGQESSKSRHVRCARQPLLAPQSQGWKWAGGSANLLLRLEVMLNMQEKSSLDPRQWGVVAKIVEGLQGCSFQHEGVLWTEVLGSLKHMADNRQRPTDQLRSHIKTLCTQELNQWQQQRSEDYKQWLQGAVASYLSRCSGQSKSQNKLWCDLSERCRRRYGHMPGEDNGCRCGNLTRATVSETHLAGKN